MGIGGELVVVGHSVVLKNGRVKHVGPPAPLIEISDPS